MVFDEVDFGIGGVVVDIVGQKLCVFGEKCQVLCVIYLLQVVFKGYVYYWVSKVLVEGMIQSVVEKLDNKVCEEELVCMFGGVEVSKEVWVVVCKLLQV